MKKKNSMTFGQRLKYFFRHYFLLLLLALGCAAMTVLLIALIAL